MHEITCLTTWIFRNSVVDMLLVMGWVYPAFKKERNVFYALRLSMEGRKYSLYTIISLGISSVFFLVGFGAPYWFSQSFNNYRAGLWIVCLVDDATNGSICVQWREFVLGVFWGFFSIWLNKKYEEFSSVWEFLIEWHVNAFKPIRNSFVLYNNKDDLKKKG